ncbi:MAG TPA: DUF5947 family protein [Tepidisphaeraceae bacterium]|nr:DUF5947 family protein [Tepidisphaeraceae bacterium]
MTQVTTSDGTPSPGAIAALRRFSRPRPAQERCELCSAVLAPEHQHLLDPTNRQLLCSCEACAILFSDAAATKYRLVPRRIEAWPDFAITDEQWDALGIPIGLAFFYRNSVTGHIATIYPSPAGGTESLLQEECWEMLCEQNPVLRTLLPDVEALLVNRVGGARDYHRVPIDECYKLVGLIRTNWRGLSGGKDVWARIAGFFTDLRSRGVGTRKDA